MVIDEGLRREHQRVTTGVTVPPPPGPARGMEQSNRMSGPPPPPPQFHEQANRRDPGLSAEHLRLKPGETGVRGAPPNVLTQTPAWTPPVLHNPSVSVPTVTINPRDTRYPRWRFHPTAAPVGMIVKSELEEAAQCVGDGWVDNPGKFPPSAKRTADKLDAQVVQQVTALLSDQRADGEDIYDALLRIMGERDLYARQIASLVTSPADAPELEKEKPSGARKSKSVADQDRGSVQIANEAGN